MARFTVGNVRFSSLGGTLVCAAWLSMVGGLGVPPMYGAAAECSTKILVDVYDAYGKPRKGAEISLRALTGEVLTSIVAARATFPAVPCADYVLDVHSVLGSSASSRMILRATGEMLQVRVGLPIRFGDSVGEGGHFTLRARLVGSASGLEDLWARLAGVYLPLRLDYAVGRDGRFEAKGLEGGRYHIQVFQGSRCLTTEDVEIDLEGTDVVEVNIRLPSAEKPNVE